MSCTQLSRLSIADISVAVTSDWQVVGSDRAAVPADLHPMSHDPSKTRATRRPPVLSFPRASIRTPVTAVFASVCYVFPPAPVVYVTTGGQQCTGAPVRASFCSIRRAVTQSRVAVLALDGSTLGWAQILISPQVTPDLVIEHPYPGRFHPYRHMVRFSVRKSSWLNTE